MPSAAPTPLFEAIAPEAAGMPLYRVVKRSLVRAIESGRCPPGETLPSETQIAGAMRVSIGTLRRAVDELAAEHVLVRRQGRGTFVTPPDPDRFLFEFFPVERADGLREAPRVDLMSFERGRAEAEPALALQLHRGDPVIRIENCLTLQGEPVVYERLTLPSTLFKGLTEKSLRDRPGTIYQLYQSQFGITVLRASERARAGAADRAAVRVLKLPLGQPVMQVRRIAATFGDQPVEHRISIINTAHHDYVNALSRAADLHD